MRKDILINVENNDLKLANSFRPTATFRLISIADQVLGAAVVDDDYKWETYSQSGYISIEIPYLPYDMPVSISVVRMSGGTETIETPYLPLTNRDGDALSASFLSAINRSAYILKEDSGKLVTYSGDDYDFRIGNANPQNKAALLDCIPGNNYRYPTVGVGLMRWTGAPSNLPGLAKTLMQEFEADGTPVISARYSQPDKTLYLNLDTHNVDANENL